jgi:hypothetical protein
MLIFLNFTLTLAACLVYKYRTDSDGKAVFKKSQAF